MILNDGTALDGASVILSAGMLFLYMPALSMGDAFGLLYDHPEKTARITAVEGPDEKVYERYVKLTALRDEGNMITAILTREADD